MRRQLCGLVALLSLTAPALSAPLFPDVPDNHWAKDAVAALAAKGLVEGYPDGTFKGDRAASRWEVAMIVARLLAKMEQEHATFATKAELDELRKLVDALREELQALGVRVQNLEENVARLDKRVTELERITFYGEINTRVVAQSFANRGSSGQFSAVPGTIVPTLNYQQAVGTATGAGGVIPAGNVAAGLPFNPFIFGVLTATDWRGGRPFVGGIGYTSSATLGVRVKVNDDIDANAEFAAYTAGGDPAVDSYYGVTAPYLSNAFNANTLSSNGTVGLQSANQTPYTKMTLDNIWLRHKPSRTELRLGALKDTRFDSITYVQQLNPNYYGPKYLNGYGADVRGDVPLDEDESMMFKYEAMYTRVADGNSGINPLFAAIVQPNTVGQGYFTHAEGGNVALEFDEERGIGRINFLHVANEASGGAALQVGLIQVPNFTLNWVNPSGFFVGQQGGVNALNAGIGSVTDTRPVPGINLPGIRPDGSLAGFAALGLPIAGVPNVGALGPQDETLYGATFNYTFDNEFVPWIRAEYSHSSYKPQKNSGYTTSGNAFRVGVGASFFDESLDVEANWVSTDARYDPFIIQIPQVDGISTPLWRSPDFNYINSLYSLHDTSAYPHNREGIRAAVTWRFLPTGRVTVDYSNLHQKSTSLQDVRFSANSLAPGTPNTPVLGYSPGFVEPVFGGYSPLTFAASGANLLATPLEDNRGKYQAFGVAGGYKYLFDEENSNRGILISGGARNFNWYRVSNMSTILGGAAGLAAENQNFVDVTNRGWRVAVDYDVTDNFTAGLGFTNVDIFGHLDPLGTYNGFAAASGNPRYTIIDITQRYPDLRLSWDVAENMTWGLDARYIWMVDNVDPRVFASPTNPNLNVAFGPQLGTHPFNWNGFQISSSFSFKF